LLLAAQPDMVVVASVGTIEQARHLLPEATPDIGLIDLDLPDGLGTTFIHEIRRSNPDARVIVLTGLTSQGEYGRAVLAGATWVLHKSAPLQDVLDAIRNAAAGRVLLKPEEAIALMRIAEAERQQFDKTHDAICRLTPRERELLQLLADGLSDKEMALRLGLSAKTIRNHMTGVLDALGVESRLQALIAAARFGIIDFSAVRAVGASKSSFT
jgi:DNA-binding NarL/FixJ family response regulator